TVKKGKYLGRTCKVGEYAPNAFGLHDMHGNVWEWCSDWFDEAFYKTSTLVDPFCQTGERKYRVLRGGSWLVGAATCRSSFRDDHQAADRLDLVGFRVALSID